MPKTVKKPWGYYRDLLRTKDVVVKEIGIKKGHRLSLQSHEHRDEEWTFIRGRAMYYTENYWDEGYQGKIREHRAWPGLSVHIAAGIRHRLRCGGRKSEEIGMVLIEVQVVSQNIPLHKRRKATLSEEDITRYEDDYGRTQTTS